MKALQKVSQKIKYTSKELWDLWSYMCQRLKGKVFPKSLLGRFILIILLPLLALQIIASMVFFENHWYLISRRLAQDIIGEVNTLVYVLEEYPDSDETKSLLKQMESNLMFDIVFLIDETLKIKTSSDEGSCIV